VTFRGGECLGVFPGGVIRGPQTIAMALAAE
jgi:N-acyl-D-amino-acid deacylase